MKKLLVSLLIILTLFLSLFATACKEEFTLLDYVSVLKSDVYQAEYKGVTLTADYGYIEEPLVLDGKKGNTTNYLTIKMPINEENVTYKIKLLTLDGEWAFKYDSTHASLVAKIPLSEHLVDFDATVSCESEQTTVKFTSILPKNILSPKDALKVLESSQKTYIDGYKNAGSFSAEIILKASVFKNNVYYYVTIADGNKNYKAMLINAVDGKLLAIRDVY
jgi:hypothetical protein